MFIQGYEETKRYIELKMKPQDNPEDYWKFVYDNDISNLIMLFDREEEDDVRLLKL